MIPSQIKEEVRTIFAGKVSTVFQGRVDTTLVAADTGEISLDAALTKIEKMAALFIGDAEARAIQRLKSRAPLP